MRYKVSYLNQGEDGWMASVYSLPGCHTEGETKALAKGRLLEALNLYFDDTTTIVLVDEDESSE